MADLSARFNVAFRMPWTSLMAARTSKTLRSSGVPALAAVHCQRLDGSAGIVVSDGPGAGAGGSHAEEFGAETRAGAWHLAPGSAVPVLDQGVRIAGVAVAPNRPRVARGYDGHAGQLAGCWRARGRHALPRRAVPVLDQGPPDAVLGLLAHRPGVGGGDRGHRAQAIGERRAGRVGAGHALPRGAVPVQDQGLEPVLKTGGLTYCPGVGGRDGGHSTELVVAGTRIRARHLQPRGAVPPHDQGELVRDAGAVEADGPGISGRRGGDGVE